MATLYDKFITMDEDGNIKDSFSSLEAAVDSAKSVVEDAISENSDCNYYEVAVYKLVKTVIIKKEITTTIKVVK